MSRWLSLPTSLRDIDAELKARQPKDELPEHLAHLHWATAAEHEEFRALIAAGGSAASVEGRGAVLQRRWLRRRESGCLQPGYRIAGTREVVAGNLSCVAGADGCSCAEAVVDGDGEVSSRTLWRAHLDSFKPAVAAEVDTVPARRRRVAAALGTVGGPDFVEVGDAEPIVAVGPPAGQSRQRSWSTAAGRRTGRGLDEFGRKVAELANVSYSTSSWRALPTVDSPREERS